MCWGNASMDYGNHTWYKMNDTWYCNDSTMFNDSMYYGDHSMFNDSWVDDVNDMLYDDTWICGNYSW